MGYERDNIRNMSGYAPGEQPEDAGVIKLNTNENPYPPSPLISGVLARLGPDDLRRYPPPTANRFRDAAAARHGVARDNIIATRGGDELLRLVITTFVDPGRTIAMTDPTYSLYPVLAQVQDCPVTKIPLGEDWSLAEDFVRQVNAAGAKLTLLVNPHAPSGRLLDLTQLRAVAEGLDGLLLIDEAYVDFIDPELGYESVSLTASLANVIILRTLSKGYALAGLRFGYGIGPAPLIRPMLEKTRDSYNLDTLSQAIAEAAFGDAEHARQGWEKVRAERQRVAGALSDLGLHVSPSQTNFLLATVPAAAGSAKAIHEAARQCGVLLRYFDEPVLADKLRITIGTPEENDAMIEALRASVNGAG